MKGPENCLQQGTPGKCLVYNSTGIELKPPRHQLADKIRRLTGASIHRSQQIRRWETSIKVEIKQEQLMANVLLMPHQKSYRLSTFYQPLIHSCRKSEKNVIFIYHMPEMEKNKEQSFAVENASQRKFRQKKKKRRSSTFSRVEEILSTGKDILLLPEPSEESVAESLQEVPEVKKDITHLSDDILQNVFWYFSLKERCTILSRVCKRWYHISKNPLFWRYLEFNDDQVPTKIILRLIRDSPQLHSLKLTHVPETSVIIHELCRERTGIRELSVRYCVMNRMDSVHVLLQIATTLPNLEILDLKGTEFFSKRFYTELCLLKNLKCLNLGSNRYLQPRDIMTISINCHQLQSLEILDIPSNSKGKLSDENFRFIMQRLRNSLLELKFDMQQLKNPSYLAILTCTKLQTLALANCIHLTGEMFTKFSQLKNLKNLTLTRAINLESEDFAVFEGEHMKNVEELNIQGCWRLDEAGVKHIVRGLPLLKRLSLADCTSVTRNDLRPVSQCKQLDTLNIANCAVAPKHISEIIKSQKTLRFLTIDKNMYDNSLDEDITNTENRVRIIVAG